MAVTWAVAATCGQMLPSATISTRFFDDQARARGEQRIDQAGARGGFPAAEEQASAPRRSSEAGLASRRHAVCAAPARA